MKHLTGFFLILIFLPFPIVKWTSDEMLLSEKKEYFYYGNHKHSQGERRTKFYNEDGNNHAWKLAADPNLVAAYGFNENSGTTVSDFSGNANTGSFTSGGWSASGKFGAAGSFNGSSSYVTIPDASTLDLTNGMTLEAWIQPSSVTGYRTVICKENGATNISYALSANDNNATLSKQRPNTRIRNSTTTTTLAGKAKLAINTWTHIACTYDGTTLRLYINGTQSSSVRVTGNMAVSASPLRIGGNSALGGEYFSGLIDEVRIYKVALTATQILADMNAPVEPDIVSPSATITNPAEGSNVQGTINVSATAQDNAGGVGVAGVQFKLDGNNLGTEDLTAPYSVSWNSTSATNGSHTLVAVARDSAGNTGNSTAVNITVNNPDLTAPTVSITAPASGSTVTGTTTVTASASDNRGVASVQFTLDGNNLGSLQTGGGPYSYSWNTFSSTNGSHNLSAIAKDTSGNTGTAATVQVTVSNVDTSKPVVAISTPTNGSTVSGTISVTATASDNIGVIGVQYYLNGNALGSEQTSSPYTISWNTATIPNGSYTLTAKARDAAGNQTTSATVQVTTSNTDNVNPSVSITEPIGGSTLSGTVILTADATDNNGVAYVQFVLDNTTNLGVADSTFPYQFSWNTVAVSNGNHSIKAIAKDIFANSTTSASVNYTINNDLTPPAVNITAPTAGATVSGIVSVTASATDNIGVSGVQFLLNGNLLGAEDNSSPYSVSWNTGSYSNGSYSISAIARDAFGNKDTSTVIQVQVNNTSNLITALPLNEGTGTTAADLSGRNHPGTLTNSSWTTGKSGQGVSFTGTGSYVSLGDHADYTLSPSKSYTWSAWVKNNDFKAWSTIFSHSVSGSTSNYFYFYSHSIGTVDNGGGPVTNGISVYWYNNSTNYVALHSNSFVMTAGQWNHVAITYDASKALTSRFSIFVNGVDQTDRNAIGSSGVLSAIDPTAIQIGNNAAYPGEYLNGSVDEFRFYDKLLSAAEIQTDMATAIQNDTTAPVISIATPSNAANVSGNVTVTANASDNVGVAGVQFMLDGINIDSEDVTSPYSIVWNSQLTTLGTHTLSARARDARGNSTTTSISVNVVQDFLLTILDTVKNVEQTGQTDFRIYVSYLNGYTTGGINLAVSGLPSGATGNFLMNPMSHQGETQLYVTTSNAALGSKTFTITATSFDGKTKSGQAKLNITTTADFSLTATPSIQTVAIGSSVSYTINLNETNDYTSPVALSISGLPTGVTASFNPTSVTPVGSTTLTLTASSSAAAGTYNLTVTGTSNSLVRTVPITLSVSTTPSVWNIQVIGSTGTANNTVRVGALKGDGKDRVYVGTIGTGRMLEYSWSGTSWAGPVNVGGSPTGAEIHDCNIGDARGDGKQRLYAASYDYNIYEIWYNGSSWQQMVVGGLYGKLGMHMAMGDGRNDGVTRLYAASTDTLYEFTWNSTNSTWNRVRIGYTPGAHGVAIGKARGTDPKNYIYIASISSGNFEVYWNGSSWVINSMGDNGDSRGIGLGDGRNDGKTRVYAAMYDGTMREFTWSGTAWTFNNLPNTGIQNVHAYVIKGRNDGVNRLYTDNGNGKVMEYTWNGSGWTTYNMGGGSDYMYGLHYGNGRNDGLLRLYSTDRGSVNRVYEFTWGTSTTAPAQNLIVSENTKPGNSSSEWDVSGAGDASIQGFATDMSVNKGQMMNFKVNVSGNTTNYSIKIYRIGYYQGKGARLITTLGPYTGVSQPSPVSNTSLGLVDCGNWSNSASWSVPSDAVSGVYIARLVRADNGGASHMIFVVRDDQSTADILFKTSDATWQAYNVYGGNSLYTGSTGYAGGHAVKVSYNRPFITRAGGGGGGASEDWFFNAEYPMIRWLERNGYDIRYITDLDFERMNTSITPAKYKILLSVGHDEYWSAAERNRFEEARNAGVHLAFFSGNEVYWKTRWENSIDGNNTPYRTLVCYKEGNLGENICYSECDPSNSWTGLWRSGCGASASDGCKPENALTGQISWELYTGSIQVPAAFKDLPLWRNTSIPSMSSSQITTLPYGTLGYETDFEQSSYASYYPSGRITLSSTFYNGKEHRLSLYKHTSGSLIFGAGTVQWSWGLDDQHDRGNAAASPIMQQATVNLFADMGVQARSLQSGLVQTAPAINAYPFTTFSADPLIVLN